MTQQLIKLSAMSVVLLIFCNSCSNSPTKTLNNDSAKRMLEASMRAKNEQFEVPSHEVIQKIRISTHEDYMQGSYKDDDARRAIQRLLQSGFMVQSREDLRLPNVSGKYSAMLQPNDGWIENAVYNFELSMRPAYSDISGEYSFDSWYTKGMGGHKSTSFRGPVRGSVNEDGTVTLVYGPMSTEAGYTFSASGREIKLTGRQPFIVGTPTMTLTGTGPGGILTIPKFSYSPGQQFRSLLDQPHY
jgi:hypothetical protein